MNTILWFYKSVSMLMGHIFQEWSCNAEKTCLVQRICPNNNQKRNIEFYLEVKHFILRWLNLSLYNSVIN